MGLPDRISVDPEICLGKPIIKGTRLKVEFILDLLAAGNTHEEIITGYKIQEEDILAVLEYAKDLVERESVYTLPAFL
jgi:uncharacterized protein (DUF433 family)